MQLRRKSGRRAATVGIVVGAGLALTACVGAPRDDEQLGHARSRLSTGGGGTGGASSGGAGGTGAGDSSSTSGAGDSSSTSGTGGSRLIESQKRLIFGDCGSTDNRTCFCSTALVCFPNTNCSPGGWVFGEKQACALGYGGIKEYTSRDACEGNGQFYVGTERVIPCDEYCQDVHFCEEARGNEACMTSEDCPPSHPW